MAFPRWLSARLLVALVCLPTVSIACTGSPCETDGDCAAAERCVILGGVFSSGSVCIGASELADVLPDEADSTRVDEMGIEDVGTDSRVPDGGGEDLGPDAGYGCDPLVQKGDDCDPVEEVAVLRDGTCLRRASGTVACWSFNQSGVAGNGQTVLRPQPRPELVVNPDAADRLLRATSLCGGNGYACAVDRTGAVRCWGYGHFLGIGEAIDWLTGFSTPQLVTSAEPEFAQKTFEAVHCGGSSTCAIDADGGVWCWGLNRGSSTDPTTTAEYVDRARPIDLPEPATDVSIGAQMKCALLASGVVHCWGTNVDGALGSDVSDAMPAGPLAVDFEQTVTAIESAGMQTCAITEDAEVYCWGDVTSIIDDRESTFAPLPLADLPGPVDEVGVGLQAVCIRSGTSVHCRGSRHRGAIGDGMFVENGEGEPQATLQRVEELPPVRALEMNEYAVCAFSDGLPWCWGTDTHYQLGRSFDLVVDEPVSVALPQQTETLSEVVGGRWGPCARSEAGEVHCWGFAAPGVERSFYNYATAIPKVIGLSGVSSIARGDEGAIAVVDQTFHRLLSKGPFLVAEPKPVDVLQAAQSSVETCWIRESDFIVECDAPGRGDDPTPGDPGIFSLEIQAGKNYHCVLHQQDGVLECWGNETWGERGDGGPNDNRFGVDPVDLGRVARYDIGLWHSCAILDEDDNGEGGVHCWGRNDFGQVGVDPGSTTMLHQPSEVSLGAEAVDVATGRYHTCAALVNEEVWCWGSGLALPGAGDDHVPRQVSGISASRVFGGSWVTFARDDNDPDRLLCFGTDAFGECGTGRAVFSSTPAPMTDIGP